MLKVICRNHSSDVFSKQQYYIAALRLKLLPTTRAECIVFSTANKEFLHGTGDNQKQDAVITGTRTFSDELAIIE